MRRLWLAIPLALATVQCGGVTRTNGNDLCAPGEQIECNCAGRTKGIRTCSAEGIGYGECSCSGTDGGATTSDASGPSPDSCTSRSAWMNGLQGSAEMTPGRPCIDCHAKTPKAPQFTVAGTIFPGPNDPDDCNGIDGTLGGAVAFLQDDGAEFVPRVQLNRVGNFFVTRAMPPLYRVKVIAEGRESVMQMPVTNGDCNACHTASGTMGARGRLTKPKP